MHVPPSAIATVIRFRTLVETCRGLVAALGLAAVAGGATAATKTWDGGGGNTNWTNPANWSPDGVPTAADDVVIPLSSFTVTNPSNATSAAKSITCAGTLVVAGGSLTVEGPVSISGGFTQTAGTFAVNGPMTLDAPATWSGGTWSGAGETTVLPGRTLTISNGSLQRGLVNQGTVDWTGGTIALLGATITNVGEWTITGSGDRAIGGGCCGFVNAFVNEGSLRMQSPSTVSFSNFGSAIPITSTGSIVVEQGLLAINELASIDGALTLQAGSTLRHTGNTMTLQPGLVVLADGAVFQQQSGSLVLNISLPTGTHYQHSGGTATLNAAQTFGTGDALSNATLNGPGSITVDGDLSVSASSTSGAGAFTVADGATLTLSNGFTIGRPWTNLGTISWANSTISLAGSAFDNQGELVVSGPGDRAIGGACCAFVNSFTNAGLFRVETPASVSVTSFGSSIPFTSTGEILVAQGTLVLNEASSLSGALTLAPGTTLRHIANTTTFEPSLALLADGATLQQQGGTLVTALALPAAMTYTHVGGTFTSSVSQSFGTGDSIANGTLNVAGDISIEGAVPMSAMSIAGNGAFHVAAGATLTLSNGFTISRPWTNLGVVQWINSSISLAGCAFENQGEIVIAGIGDRSIGGACCGFTNSFTNAGLLRIETPSTVAVTSFGSSMPFTSSGEILVLQGTFVVNEASSLGGAITLAPDTTLRHAASAMSLEPSLELVADGATFQQQGGQLIVAIPLPEGLAYLHTGGTFSSNLAQTFGDGDSIGSATISVAGGITITGSVSVSAATLTSDASIVVAKGATLTLSNGITLVGSLTNVGTIHWTNSTISLAGCAFDNQGEVVVAGGGDRSIGGACCGFINSFTNAGSILIDTSSTVAVTSFGSPTPFTSTGEIVVSGGTFVVNEPSSLAGSFTLALGTTLRHSAGTMTFESTLALSADGATLQQQGGTLASTISLPTAMAFAFTGGVLSTDVSQTFGNGDSFTSGSLGGDGAITIDGAVSMSAMTVSTGDSFTVADGGTVAISNGLTIFRPWINHGTIEWMNATISLAGCSFENHGSFVVAGSGDRSIGGACCGFVNAFTNAGLFRVDTPSTVSVTTFGSSMPFTSTGEIAVEQGTLVVNEAASIAGTLALEVGSTLRHAGNTMTLEPTLTFTGDGATLAQQGGTLVARMTLPPAMAYAQVGGTLTIEAEQAFGSNTSFANGVLNGPASASIVGNSTMSGMNVSTGGPLVVSPSGTLAVGNGLTLGTDLTVLGVVDWTSSTISLVGADVVVAGEWRISGTQSRAIGGACCGFTNSLQVSGLLRHMSSGQTDVSTFGSSVGFANSGIVEVEAGSLRFVSPLANFSGTTLTGGTWRTASTLVFPNVVATLAATLELDGPNAVVESLAGGNGISGLSAISSKGTLRATGNGDPALTPSGGELVVEGTLAADAGSTIAINGAVTFAAGAEHEVERDGTDASLVATGTATLNGTLDLDFTPSFAPSAGTSWNLLVASGGRTGTFSLLQAPSNVSLFYGATNVQVDVGKATPTPDLVVAAFASVGPFSAGEPVDIAFTEKNQGVAAAEGSWVDNAELLAGGPKGQTVATYGPVEVTGRLAPGASAPRAIPATLPFVDGTFVVAVNLDIAADLDEGGGNAEANNRFLSPAIEIRASNLVPGTATVPTSITSTVPTDLTVATTNVGSGASFGPAFVDRVLLSTDAALSGDDLLLAAIDRSNDSIAAGASVAATIAVTVPESLAPGTYHVLVASDATALRFESNDFDNAASVAIVEVLGPPRPNLVVAGVSLPASAEIGGTFTVTWTVENVGDLPAIGSWIDQAFLSTDALFGDDVALAPAATVSGPIAPGASKTISRTYVAPQQAGIYAAFVRTDHANAVNEGALGEDDNLSVASNAMTVDFPPSPDLTIPSLSAPSTGVGGQPIMVSWLTQNDGEITATGSWRDALYLSSDAILSADDAPLGEFVRSGPIEAGESARFVTQVTVPIVAPGSYTIIVRADVQNVVDEKGGEANNVTASTSPTDVSEPPLADLRVLTVSAPSSAVVGESISVSWQGTNEGELGTGAGFLDRVYLSSDPSFSTNDVLVATRPQAALDAGATWSGNAVFVAPSTVGPQFAIVVTDAADVVDEGSGEGNNVVASVSPITIAESPKPNLVPSAISVPIGAAFGTPVEVSWTVSNAGTGDGTGPWSDQVYLSSDAALSPDDLLLKTQPFAGTLAVGASYVRTTAIPLPESFTGGTRRLIVVTDFADAETESVETDNAVASDAFEVAPTPAPDLRALNVAAGSATAVFGESLDVSWSIDNVGLLPASGPWSDGLFLSADATLSANDVAIASVPKTGGGLDVGATYAASKTVVLPISNALPEGTYRVLVRADALNGQAEPDEANNVLASAPIAITRPPLPDLVVALSNLPASAAPGTPFTVDVVFENVGDAELVGNFSTRLQIPGPDGALVPLQEFVTSGPIAAGGSKVVSRSVTLPPLPGGSATLVVCADSKDDVVEQAESNCIDASIALDRPDLIALSVSGPSSATAGDSVTFTITARNDGNVPVTGFWSDALYLSTDAVVGADRFLASRTQAGPLAPGATTTAFVSVVLPNDLEGTYVPVLLVDSSNLVLESNEGLANALVATEAAVEIAPGPRPNLVVANVSLSESIVAAGSPLTVQWTVTNVGDAPTSVVFTDAVYASENGIITGADPRLGTRLESQPIGVGASIQVALDLKAPATPGDWKIAIVTDAEGTVVEKDGGESDNVTFASATLAVRPVDVNIVSAVGEVAASSPIPIVGTATIAGTPEPVPGISVRVQGTVRGFPIETTATTAADGSFAVDFPTTLQAAGLHQFRAGLVGGPLSAVQMEAVVWGLAVEFDRAATPIVANGAALGSLTVRNFGDLPIDAVALGIVASDSALQATTTLDATTIPPFGVVGGTWSITAGEDAVGGAVTLSASALQPVSTSDTMAVEIVPALPVLVATPTAINQPMQLGTVSFVDVAVKNVGFAPTGALAVQIVTAPFLSLVSPAALPSLEPGESVTVSLRVAPAEDLPLGPYTAAPGLVVLDPLDPTVSVGVALTFEATSDAIGSLTVKTTDEFSFYGVPPTYPQATIELRDPASGELVASGIADDLGVIEFTRLPVGLYKLKATAPEHNSAEGIVAVNGPGTVQDVFLSRQLVSYTFEVVPIDFIDQYVVTLSLQFQTNVPAPVVIPDPPTLSFLDMTQPVRYVEVKLTNHGLVAADDFEWLVQGTPRFEIIALSPSVGDIGPGQTVIAPFLLVDHEFGQGGVAGGNCLQAFVSGLYRLVCGPNVNAYNTPLQVQQPPTPGCSFLDGLAGLSIFGAGSFTLPGNATVIAPSFTTPAQGIATAICDSNPNPPGADGVAGGSNDGGGCVALCLETLSGGQGSDVSAPGCTIAAAAAAIGSESLSTVLQAALSSCLPRAEALCVARNGATGCDCAPDLLPLCDPEAKAKGLDPFADWPEVDLDNAGLEYYERSTFRLWASVRPAIYMLGDVAWINFTAEERDVLLNLGFALADASDPSGVEGDRIAASEAAALLALPRPSGLSDVALTRTIDRWNRTLDYYAQGIFEVADVPEGLSVDFVVRSTLQAYHDSAETALTDMASAGFDNIADETAAALAVVIDDLSSSGQGFCVTIALTLDQQITLTRQAFEARLTLDNGTEQPIQGFGLDLLITDLQGVDASDRFLVLEPALEGLDAVDGTGQLAGFSTGKATFTIIPGDSAAPETLTDYLVSGTMTYALGTDVIAIPLLPTKITVHPNPSLDLQYFIETKIFGDDPFTPELEPSVPFNLGLWAKNDGAGVAKNVEIVSAQPVIEDASRDILIDFQLIGSQVGTEIVSPSLAVLLGDIAPDSVAVARWLMICSLQGEFVDYDATVKSLNGFDDPEFAIVDNAEVSALTHAVRADEPLDDGVSDFLSDKFPDLNDLPDRVFLSSGAVEPVTSSLAATLTEVNPLTWTLTASAVEGWRYERVTDPWGGARAIVSVTRSDGKPILLGDNAWQTSYIDRTGPSPVARRDVHLFDRGGDGSYTIVFSTDTTPPTVTSWSVVREHAQGGPNGEAGAYGFGLLPGVPTSDPRAGGILRLLASFSEPVDSALTSAVNVAITAYDAQGNEVDLENERSLTLSLGDQYASIEFTPPLPDGLRYCVRLVGVKDLGGLTLDAGSARVDIAGLVGDATGDQRVTVNDAGAVASLFGTDPIDATNALHLRADINRDGRIDSLDLTPLLANVGVDLRFAPTVCTEFGGATDGSNEESWEIPGISLPPGSVADGADGGSGGGNAIALPATPNDGDGEDTSIFDDPLYGRTVRLLDDGERREWRERLDLVAVRPIAAIDDAARAELIETFAMSSESAVDVDDGWTVAAAPPALASYAEIVTFRQMLLGAALDVGVVLEAIDGTLVVVDGTLTVRFGDLIPDSWRERVLDGELAAMGIEAERVTTTRGMNLTLEPRSGDAALALAMRLSRRTDVRTALPKLIEIRLNSPTEIAP